MGKKKKPLTPYNKFVKANYDKYGGDFKKIGKAWKAKKGGKSTPKSKSKKKTTTRSVSRTTKKKPEKKVRKTAKQKSISRSVPVSSLEKKTQKLFDTVEQLRLAMSLPRSAVKLTFSSKSTSIKFGKFKTIKRSKFSDAVKALKKKVESKV